MAYWISRDNERHASYDLWTKRPTWSDQNGWEVLDANGHCDHRQPVDSYFDTSFPRVSGLRLKPGELARITGFEVTAERVDYFGGAKSTGGDS